MYSRRCSATIVVTLSFTKNVPFFNTAAGPKCFTRQLPLTYRGGGGGCVFTLAVVHICHSCSI